MTGALPDSPLVHVLVIAAATAFIWLGSGWLEEAAETLSGYYGLPEVVQGSIVVAVGSSFPELVSVLVTALTGVFDMGVGALVGSAIFNVLVIPAAAGLGGEDELEANRAIVYKEAQFYMLAVSALVVTFALAVIYFPVSTDPIVGTLPRSLAVIPLALYCLYLFIQYQDVDDAAMDRVREGIDIRREWAKLGGGLAVIVVTVERLVASVESLGVTFGVPEFLAGVTVVAAATSLPDTLVSVRTARENRGTTSLGNVLGSNTFDLLVAIPLGVLIVGEVAVNFSTAVPMLGVLTVATVLLFVTLRTSLALNERESYALLAAYGLFVAWVVAESVGVTSVLKGV
ncbi:sodium:calcium antiporter [Halorubrum ezzemoulense]|uniref:Sodium:calcium antiporter n=1 Tax=Halorubrum ezzemoulense TaxID=337243 RepID=A0A256J637_HALEZ|nr:MULTISPECIES: sodium:calcium antiporter [Halorubrum]OYR64284.1 sodium:calcium antiporter [Halorubrum ezzemoulense]OYR74927.1 sodium:calcium antiporter [Halorubrum ezzemoulense]PHQ43260.1 sodium:calcium antiporter [Halorubrum sp. C191]